MKKINFLKKLNKERRLELVEPSEEMTLSYLWKADNCLKSAKILFNNKLYENSISEAYYSMYNSLIALLSKNGIKSENHTASIYLLEKIFNEKNLSESISFAKKERIDKQYYIENQKETKLIKESSKEMIFNSEDFLIKIKLLIGSLNEEEIRKIRISFKNLFE